MKINYLPSRSSSMNDFKYYYDYIHWYFIDIAMTHHKQDTHKHDSITNGISTNIINEPHTSFM